LAGWNLTLMKVLVSGANGFVGSHVAERLAAKGVELRLMLRRTSDVRYLEGLEYERVNVDLRDPESLTEACRGVDAVVHLAVQTLAPSESLFQQVNALGTANLVHAARSAGVKRFVYISSLAAQGPNPDRETLMPDPPAPVSAYGRSKLAGENAVLAACPNIDVAIVRLSAVYGQRDKALLPLYRMGKLGFVPVYGDGENLLSWLHVYDAADAIVATVLGKTPSGAVYTVSDGGFYTWKQLVASFGLAWGRTPRIIYGPPFLFRLAGAAGGLAQILTRKGLSMQNDQVRHMQARYFICDNTAITRDLGWQPKIDLDAGFAQTIAWCRQQGLL
jgi:nucleoside-diphosphate-sugar epimerase